MRLQTILPLVLAVAVAACSAGDAGTGTSPDVPDTAGDTTQADAVDAPPDEGLADAPDGEAADASTDLDAAGDDAADAPTTDVPNDSDATADTTRVDVATEHAGAEPDAGGATVPSFVVGTWNLHNFSVYGTDEYRIGDLAARIEELSPDLLGVEELKVEDGTDGSPPQAWNALLDLLPAYAGLHAPWDLNDSTDGLLYRTDRVSVDGVEVLFEDDWWAFPRSPLVVQVTVTEGGASAAFSVIVLHLKAFDADADRRLAACERLDAWIDDRPDREFVIVGDLNDDPYDPPDDNVFAGTFLGVPDQYVFVTEAFPPETVTSTGWHHYVDGVEITGELIDHVIVTTPFYGEFGEVTPAVYGVPESQFSAYRSQYSDHFPVMVTFQAP